VVTITAGITTTAFQQTLTTVAGATYSVSIARIGGTSSAANTRPRIANATLSSPLIQSSATTTFVFVASGTSTQVGLTLAGSVGETVEINTISVKELPGNHAVQATTANRPIYGVHPFGGRRNLLVRTEEFDNASWSKFRANITANAAVAPDGTTTADKLIATNILGSHGVNQAVGTLPTTSSVFLKAAEYSHVAIGFNSVTPSAITDSVFDIASGTLVSSGSDVSSHSITSFGDGWYRISVSSSGTATTAQCRVSVMSNSTTIAYTGDNTSGILIWGAQLELGSTATAYQRVTDQYNVTEAGVPSVSYLFFDGVNDSFATSTITPGVDKTQVFAGVRKLSDAAVGIVIEHSANVGANNGSFYLASGPNGTAGWSSSSRGTTSPGALQTTEIAIAAPDTAVLSSAHDIANDLTTLRRNGVAGTSATGDKGTGNFLAYPLYIGHRFNNPPTTASSLFFSGHLYSLIARFGPNLATGQISSTETWVAGKTGIAI
jgi:hypothetical protein